ncbi:hypothetical protein K438DRAFT_1761849 [Mycena galopus ATCC 62051]|nr:hypothetical protein K438DRAFT_1761849 [Mycena galopus ATCC 62051]
MILPPTAPSYGGFSLLLMCARLADLLRFSLAQTTPTQRTTRTTQRRQTYRRRVWGHDVIVRHDVVRERQDAGWPASTTNIIPRLRVSMQTHSLQDHALRVATATMLGREAGRP